MSRKCHRKFPPRVRWRGSGRPWRRLPKNLVKSNARRKSRNDTADASASCAFNTDSENIKIQTQNIHL